MFLYSFGSKKVSRFVKYKYLNKLLKDKYTYYILGLLINSCTKSSGM